MRLDVGTDRVRLAAAVLFVAAGLVMFIAGIANGHGPHVPLLPAACAAVLIAQSRPRETVARRKSQREFEVILAELEARDAGRAQNPVD